MAIGVNWAEVWAPVWGAVWTQEAPSPSPTPSPQTPTGGYGNYALFDTARDRRERRRQLEKQRKRDEDEIQQEIDRNVAAILYEQELKDAERADLARIQALADNLMRQKTALPRPMLASVMKAHEERTQNALLQLERVVSQMLEDEELAAVSVLLFDE